MSKLLVAFSAFMCSLSSAPITYYTVLSGPAENPANASPGTGLAQVTIDAAAHTMSLSVSFSGLIGTVTAAHIHCCVAAPGNASVATTTPTFPGFPGGVTAGSYAQTFDTTLASSFRAGFITDNGGIPQAEAALFTGIAAGQAYFNIHSTAFPGGEIRGFLEPVPEPSTLALSALSLTGLIALRRRRR